MGALLGNQGPNLLTGGIDAATAPVTVPQLSVVTQAHIDMMNLAIASPERQVTLGGQTITYRSIADMILARDALKAILDRQALALRGQQPRPRRTYAVYGGRGYNSRDEG